MAMRFSAVLRLAPIMVLSAILAACSSTAMPTGYTYHHEIYRTPPGPEAKEPAKILASGQDVESGASGTNNMGGASGHGLGMNGQDVYTASAHMDADGRWDMAADELVQKILRDLGRPMEKVHVPGNNDFVTALKASLARHNIPVMDRVGDGPFVIQHQISGHDVMIEFYSNHSSILTESGSFPPVSAIPTP